MLPPSYLDQMPDAFVQLWQQVEDADLTDVARAHRQDGRRDPHR